MRVGETCIAQSLPFFFCFPVSLLSMRADILGILLLGLLGGSLAQTLPIITLPWGKWQATSYINDTKVRWHNMRWTFSLPG